MPQPNQIDRECEDVRVAAADLLAVPQGVITEAGLRQNINVVIGYIEAWLRRLRPALPPDGGRSVALRSGNGSAMARDSTMAERSMQRCAA
jgi:hypothetical protein